MMKNSYKIIIAILLSLAILLSANQKQELNYEFIQENTYYSFRGSFIVKSDANCLIDLIYDFEQLSGYSLGAKSIKLIQRGDNWYDVSYTYRKLIILENRSTWRRILVTDEQKVIFKMISSKNNLKIMPEVISSEGYYQIKKEKDGCRVEYFQECMLKPGFFKSTYIKKAKKEAIKFMHEFKKYIETECN